MPLYLHSPPHILHLYPTTKCCLFPVSLQHWPPDTHSWQTGHHFWNKRSQLSQGGSRDSLARKKTMWCMHVSVSTWSPTRSQGNAQQEMEINSQETILEFGFERTEKRGEKIIDSIAK